MKKKILLSTPTLHGNEIDYVKEAFDRNWVAPLGFNCDLFEKETVEYLLGKDSDYHALCLSSGTAAIHLAMRLAGVGRGDTVFASDMTFCATVNPIIYEGATPVFIDSERDTWNMDPVALEAAFQKYPDTKVVIVVHLYGVPAKMDEITEICKRHGAILIEDAAESLSALYKGRPCGTLGEYNILSFNGNKIITTSGGGMLLTASKAARDKAFFYATQAREAAPWYQHEEIGYNYRLSNICAGIGRGQLVHVDAHKAAKKRIYERYKRGFAGTPIKMNPYLPDTEPNFWLSCITVDEGVDVEPMKIVHALCEAGIESRPIWKPMHMQPVFSENDFIKVAKDAVGADIFARGVCLPSDIKMTEEEQDEVIAIVKSCVEG